MCYLRIIRRDPFSRCTGIISPLPGKGPVEVACMKMSRFGLGMPYDDQSVHSGALLRSNGVEQKERYNGSANVDEWLENVVPQ